MGDERGQPPPASPGVRWRLALAATLALLASAPPRASAICPSKCACDDDVLRATCESAGLEVVPIQLNPEVRSISLRGNRIASLHMSFAFYTNLRWLDLSHNRVATLGARVFEFQDKLVHLNISGNEVSGLSKDAFRGLRSLRVLDLSGNLLEALSPAALADTPDLAELDLSANRLLSLPERAFERLHQLRVLRLDRNQLLEVPAGALRRLPALKTLGLSDNLLEALGEDGFPPLRDLRALLLQGNVLMQVDRQAFAALPALQTLDLSDNNLTSVPTHALSKLPRLADLDLSGNALSSLPAVAFQSLFELRRLRLSRLPALRRVDARALADNVRLESVQLDDTGLAALPQRLFHERRALVHLSLRGNSFTSLDAAQLPLDQLRSLSLGDNPLHCNCSLLWLWLLTRRQAELEARNASASSASASVGAEGDGGGGEEATPHLDVDAIRCAQPDPLRGRLVADAPEAAVRCDASWLSVVIVAIVVLALFAGTCGLLLVLGSGRWCRRPGDDEAEASAALQAHGHLQNGAVLMLVTSKDHADPMDTVVLPPPLPLPPYYPRQHQRFAPDAWDPPCKETSLPADPHDHNAAAEDGRVATPAPPPYRMNGSSRKPHIVYV